MPWDDFEAEPEDARLRLVQITEELEEMADKEGLFGEDHQYVLQHIADQLANLLEELEDEDEL